MQPRLKPGTRLNIIQHPDGRPKQIALRSNFYIGIVPEARRLHYLSDTEGGSSGSPVLNDKLRVVALHHGGGDTNDYYSAPPIRLDSLGLQMLSPGEGERIGGQCERRNTHPRDTASVAIQAASGNRARTGILQEQVTSRNEADKVR